MHNRANWSDKGHYVCETQKRDLGRVPVRQGCVWTLRESYDVLDAYTAGVPIELLAVAHKRSRAAIQQHLFNENGTRALKRVENYLNSGGERPYRHVGRWSYWVPNKELWKWRKQNENC